MKLTPKIFVVILLTLGMFGAGIYSRILAENIVNIAPDVLKSLVDADAALLGFLGIIAVYVLTTYRDSMRLTEEQIYRTRLEHERETRVPSDPNIPVETQLNSADKEYKIFKDRLKKLEDYLERLRTEAREICLLAATGAILFVTSILLCLLGMSEISVEVKINAIGFSVGFMLFGLISLLFMVIYYLARAQKYFTV